MTYETKCHGECKTIKENFLFTPGQLSSKWPICRECAKEANKRRWPANNVPADRGFNDDYFPGSPAIEPTVVVVVSEGCCRCSAPLDKTGNSALCPTCRDQVADRSKRVYERNKRAGICTKCKKESAVAKHVHCTACLESRRVGAA